MAHVNAADVATRKWQGKFRMYVCGNIVLILFALESLAAASLHL